VVRTQRNRTARQVSVLLSLTTLFAACSGDQATSPGATGVPAVSTTVAATTTSTRPTTTTAPSTTTTAAATSTTAPRTSTSTAATSSTVAGAATTVAGSGATTIPAQPGAAPTATTVARVNPAGGALPAVPQPSNALVNEALAYIGAIPPTAPLAGEPVIIGFINQDGGTAPLTESTFGVDAAVELLNGSLGGLKGRPIELRRCPIKLSTDGARCAKELTADPAVLAIVIGSVIDGEAGLFDALGTAKPVVLANPLTLRQYASASVVSFTPGPPTQYRGLAVAAFDAVGGATPPAKVTVVITDTPAYRNAAGTLLEPALTKLGVTTVNRISLLPGASFDQASLVLATADFTTTQAIVMLGEPSSCAALAATLAAAAARNDAWGKAPVITTQGCQGPVMDGYLTTSAIAAATPPAGTAASTDPVTTTTIAPPPVIGPLPQGWMIGGYTGLFSPRAADQQAATNEALLLHAATSATAMPKRREFADTSFGAVLTLARVVNYLGFTNLDTPRMRTSLSAFRGPAWGFDGRLACGEQAPFIALCGAQIRVVQVAGAELVVADVGTDGSIRPSTRVPATTP
jgi:hypothetical protein